VLGAVTITSEYSTEMIHTSLAVMPRRSTLIAAKAVAFGAVALVTGLVASFAAFFLGQALMSGHHISTTLGQPHVLRAVIGGALFLTVGGLLGLGLGLILRHTAAAVGAAVGLLYVPLILAQQLPSSWQVSKRAPFSAGGQIWGAVAVGAHVLRVDRLRGVLRLRGQRDHRRPDPLPQTRRLTAVSTRRGRRTRAAPGALLRSVIPPADPHRRANGGRDGLARPLSACWLAGTYRRRGKRNGAAAAPLRSVPFRSACSPPWLRG